MASDGKMADLLEKIGRYFAAQELQTRQTYTAQYAANRQSNQIQQPLVSLVVRVPEQPQRPMKQPPPSLVRRRLPTPSKATLPGHSATPALPLQLALSVQKSGDPTTDQTPRRDLQICSSNQEEEANAVSRLDANSELVQTRSTRRQSQSWDDEEASVSSSIKPKRPRQRRKLKRKASATSQQPRSLVEEARLAEQKAEKVAAALVLAQERARRIQLEAMQAQRTKQKARDEQRSKIQEQMRRIEAIRIKSKPPGTPQSARPSSAPTSVTRSLSLRSPMLPGSGEEEADTSTDEDALALSRIGFLKSMEDTLRKQMLVDLQIKQELVQDQQRKQLEMTKLQAQTLRQRDRNDKQQKIIETLSQNKVAMEKELAQLLEQASAIASERRRMEESERQERIRRQNEAERRLNAQLREEEWQRLVDQERISSEIAAEARVKADQRVKSQATAAKKPIPYCYRTRQSPSSRPSLSNNSDDRIRASGGSDSKMWFPTPEISEFEEDGLGEAPYEWDFEPDERSESDGTDLPVSENNAHSSANVESFRWQIPEFASKEQFDGLLLNDMLSSSDEDV